MREKKLVNKQKPQKGRRPSNSKKAPQAMVSDWRLEKRLGINSPLRKTFSELFYIYATMHLALAQPPEFANEELRSELNKLWKGFELTKLPIRLAYQDVKTEKTRNKRQFYFWLRNQREIKMIVEHEENNFHLNAA